MFRRAILIFGVGAAIGAGTAASALASSPIRLYLSGEAAFATLGHSCGGIQQQVYATGFAPSGYPAGNVQLSTKCGGSGRGGGYKTTTYTATASVVWTWYGETRSYGPMTGSLAGVSAEDSHGDRVYNEGTAAYLQDGEPPIEAPAAPTGVSASVSLTEEGESEFLRMNVSWTPAPETASLISSSTITATPVGSSAPVLSTTVSPSNPQPHLQPVAPSTTYLVTVTSTDAEGTSAPSAPVEVRSPNSDGEAEKETATVQSCQQNQGTIKLSPGLTETPHVQSITVKGELSGCSGPLSFQSGKYVDHLQTSEEVTCAALSSASAEPTTSPVSLTIKWAPKEAGKSTGSLIIPLSEVSLSALSGTLEGGPFAAPSSVSAGSITESFTGGSTCGVPNGKKAAKPVKSGTFSTGEVIFG